MTEHFRRLEQMYTAAPVNASIEALRITIAAGEATITLQATPDMCHAAGTVHGCHYFKPLDDAAFFAASSLDEERFVLTASFQLELYRAVTPGPLRAEGKVTKAGRSLIFAASELFDAEGRLVAKGTGTFARSTLPLIDVEAYAAPLKTR